MDSTKNTEIDIFKIKNAKNLFDILVLAPELAPELSPAPALLIRLCLIFCQLVLSGNTYGKYVALEPYLLSTINNKLKSTN